MEQEFKPQELVEAEHRIRLLKLRDELRGQPAWRAFNAAEDLVTCAEPLLWDRWDTVVEADECRSERFAIRCRIWGTLHTIVAWEI